MIYFYVCLTLVTLDDTHQYNEGYYLLQLISMLCVRIKAVFTKVLLSLLVYRSKVVVHMLLCFERNTFDKAGTQIVESLPADCL